VVAIPDLAMLIVAECAKTLSAPPVNLSDVGVSSVYCTIRNTLIYPREHIEQKERERKPGRRCDDWKKKRTTYLYT